MRKVLLLTGALLKGGDGLGLSASTGKKKGKGSRIVILIVLGLCMIPYIVLFFTGIHGATLTLKETGQERVLFEGILSMAGMMTLVFGITYVLSQFYLSNDLERLLPLPVHPSQILSAKLLVVWVYELYSTSLLILPMLAGYGVAAGWNAVRWILAALVFLLFPIVPLVYAAVFSILLMRLLRKIANKALISGISVVMMLLVIVPFSSVSGYLSGAGEDAASVLVSGNTFSMLNKVSVIFPLNRFAEAAVSEMSLLAFLIFLAGTAVFVLLFMAVGQTLYLKSVISLQEGGAKRKQMTADDEARMIRRETPLAALFAKEWRSLFRSPSFFLNTALVSFVWPVFLLLPFIISAAMGEMELSELFGDIRSVLDPGTLGTDLAADIAVLSVLILTAFAGSMGFVSGSAMSREGKSYVFMKMIPVPYRTQLTAKLAVGTVITVITTTGYSLIVLVALLFFGLDPLAVVFAVLMSLALNVIINCIDLFADLTFPKLSWETEQEAVKQNFFLIIEMLVNFVVCGGICVLYALLAFGTWIPYIPLNIGMTVLLLLLASGAYFGLMAYGNHRMKQLEA